MSVIKRRTARAQAEILWIPRQAYPGYLNTNLAYMAVAVYVAHFLL
jgi:hypothetical protein